MRDARGLSMIRVHAVQVERGPAQGLAVSTARRWDMCVVFVERRHRWWWNAWHERTTIELSGFADSQDEAICDMGEAIKRAEAPRPLGDRTQAAREHAMQDVLHGMNVIGAASRWNVTVDDLQRLVDEARATRQDES
jgi:hypothetical protein